MKILGPGPSCGLSAKSLKQKLSELVVAVVARLHKVTCAENESGAWWLLQLTQCFDLNCIATLH
jgi:hypothetical protein